MAARRLFVGGNWKCNNSMAQTRDLINNVLNKLTFDTTKVDVIVSPISIQIPYVHDHVQPSVQVAAQNSSATGTGAYTGEVSALQLKDYGLKWVIIGHSERRQYYGETNEIVAQKVKIAADNSLKVIACVCDLPNDPQNKIQAQLDAIKAHIDINLWAAIVIAYLPNESATLAKVQEVHQFIRTYLKNNLSQDVSQSTRIIYGGSVTNTNCRELIDLPNVDGFLVSSASLKPQFADIVASCNISK